MAFIPDEFNVTSYGSQLIELTANAAGTIDDTIQRKTPYETDSIRKLSTLLEKTAENIDTSEPAGVQALWQTLRRYRSNEKIQYTDELAPRINSIAQQLRDFTNLGTKRLEFLRRFCLDLCDDITAYCLS